MGAVWDFLTSGASDLIDGVRGVIDEVSTTDEERAQAEQALVEIQNAFQEKVLEAHSKFYEAQAEVLQTEMQSDSWLARSWRPILMLVFTYIIFHIHVLAPVFGVPMVTIPDQMWTLLNIGVGGYIGGRTIEKSVREMKRR